MERKREFLLLLKAGLFRESKTKQEAVSCSSLCHVHLSDPLCKLGYRRFPSQVMNTIRMQIWGPPRGQVNTQLPGAGFVCPAQCLLISLAAPAEGTRLLLRGPTTFS